MPLLQLMVRAGALPPTVPTVPSLSVIFVPVAPTVTVYVQAPPASAPAQGFVVSVTIVVGNPVLSTQVPPTSQLLLHCSVDDSFILELIIESKSVYLTGGGTGGCGGGCVGGCVAGSTGGCAGGSAGGSAGGCAFGCVGGWYGGGHTVRATATGSTSAKVGAAMTLA